MRRALLNWTAKLLASFAGASAVVYLGCKNGPLFDAQDLALVALPPIIITATVGLLPGLLSSIYVWLGFMYFVLPPDYSFAVDDTGDLTLLSVGCLASMFGAVVLHQFIEADLSSDLREQAKRKLL